MIPIARYMQGNRTLAGAHAQPQSTADVVEALVEPLRLRSPAQELVAGDELALADDLLIEQPLHPCARVASPSR